VPACAVEHTTANDNTTMANNIIRPVAVFMGNLLSSILGSAVRRLVVAGVSLLSVCRAEKE
jgi:hypothetical protein